MNIAIIGYGKMGHAIERIAIERGHHVVCHIDVDNCDDFESEAFRNADVAIEFTTPTTAVANYARAFSAGCKVVSGTTGWTAALPQVKQLIAAENATLFWTSNFSIGMNLFMRINDYCSRLMSGFSQYSPSMEEIHHIHKLDHPSGTAITLADGIIANNERLNTWAEIEDGEPQCAGPDVLSIAHRREGEVPGTHIVRWTSSVDEITLKHEAFSRDGFALGAVVAAEWLVANPDRHGLLGMNDLLAGL